MTWPVKHYTSYKELLEKSVKRYSGALFIETAKEKINFEEFSRRTFSVAAAVSRFPGRYIVLDIQEPAVFAETYLATVLTGHIACILPSGHMLPTSLADAVLIKDSDTATFLCETPLTFNRLPEPQPDLPCTVVFSSGTSAEVKGIVLTQTNLLKNTESCIMKYRYWAGERLVHILPYWHIFGLLSDLLAPLYAGSSVYIPESPFHFFKAMRYFNPHSVSMPPAMADVLCEALENTDNPKQIIGDCLQKVMCGGAPLGFQTTEKLFKHHILPCIAYGMTESLCVSITSDDDVRPGTSGIPLDCVNLRIAEDSEILVSGSSVMLGYLDDVSGTQERIRNGFLYTGDIGSIDAFGHLTILGRKSSMLVFPNGTKCIPEAVEQSISALDGVTECILSCDGYGATAKPKVVVVMQQTDLLQHSEVDEIMRRAGLFPYILSIQREKLDRNEMGKLVRNP